MGTQGTPEYLSHDPSKSKEDIANHETKGGYYDVETHEGAEAANAGAAPGAAHGELTRVMKSRHIQVGRVPALEGDMSGRC